MTERPEPTTRGAAESGPVPPLEPVAGIPRPVVVSAIVLALGLGIILGSKIKRPERLEVPVPVVAPCAGCAERERVAAEQAATAAAVAAATPPPAVADGPQPPT